MKGAAVLEFSDENPRDVLKEIISSNSGLEKPDLFSVFVRAISASKGMTRAVQWYFFINMYEGLATSRSKGNGSQHSGRKLSISQRTEQRILHAAMVESITSQLVLLDLLMPNEKTLRACRGSEVEKFGTGFQRIAQKTGKSNLVGDVLSEEQIRGLLIPADLAVAS